MKWDRHSFFQTIVTSLNNHCIAGVLVIGFNNLYCLLFGMNILEIKGPSKHVLPKIIKP